MISPFSAALLLFALTLPALAQVPLDRQSRPNIVLIYADDLGYGDISCNGATGVNTPHIDRLAREGLNFRAAYATAATCTPSRYSLLTGKYAFRQAGTGILPGDAAMILDPARASLSSALRATGYRTGVVGKWHLGLGLKSAGGPDWNRPIHPCPNDVGFDFSYIMAATGDRVPCVYVENGSVVNLDPADPIEVSYQQPFPGLPDGVAQRAELRMDWSVGHNQAVIRGIGRIGYMKGGAKALWQDEQMSQDFCRQAIRFIHESGEHPFFLYYALHNIHVPRVPNPRFTGMSQMGPRGDSIVEADWQVGEVLRTLDELGLAGHTLVILTSDNGPVIDDGYKDEATAKLGAHKPAGPFRGGKYSFYEGGTRMPFLVRWPQRIAAGKTSEALISQVDLARSLSALVRHEPAAGDFPDSQNQLAALLGEAPTGRDHIVQQAGRLALRVGDWKYIPPDKQEAAQLYQLAKDPAETTNLAAAEKEKVQELATRLEQIRKGSD